MGEAHDARFERADCGVARLWGRLACLREQARREAMASTRAFGDCWQPHLHLDCIGQGSPTVVLDHAGGASSAQWALIQPALAERTRVCAYDRAGFGWSDAATTPRDAQQKASELYELLQNANEPGPFVLVGHSHGAFVAQVFAATYPTHVAGLVLIDPGTPYDAPNVPAAINEQWKTADSDFINAAPILVRLGFFRLGAAVGALPSTGDFSPEQAQRFNALANTNRAWDVIKAEREAMPATSAQVLATVGTLQQPIRVLSAGLPATPEREVWTALNASLLAGSTLGTHEVFADAYHMDFAFNQQHTQRTTAIIVALLDELRS